MADIESSVSGLSALIGDSLRSDPLLRAVSPDDLASREDFVRTASLLQPDMRSALDGTVVVKIFDRERAVRLLERDKLYRSIGVIRKHLAETLK